MKFVFGGILSWVQFFVLLQNRSRTTVKKRKQSVRSQNVSPVALILFSTVQSHKVTLSQRCKILTWC